MSVATAAQGPSPHRPELAPQAAQWLPGLALVLATLAFAPHALLPFESLKAATISGVAVVGLVAMAIHGRVPCWPRTLTVALLALIASLALSTMLAPHPAIALLGSANRGTGIATPLATLAIAWLALAASDRAWRIWLYAFAIAATVAVGYAWLQSQGLDPWQWVGLDTRRPASTLGTPALLATALALALAGCIKLWLVDDRRLALLLAVPLLFGLVLSGSRSGLLAAAAGCVLLLRLRFGLARVIAGGVLLLALVLAANPNLRARVLLTDADARASIDVRIAIWSDALDAIEHQPVVLRHDGASPDPRASTRWLHGYGPEHVELPISAVRSVQSARSDNPLRIELIDRAHHFALDSLLERGLLGLLATLALWATALHLALGLRWKLALAALAGALAAAAVATTFQPPLAVAAASCVAIATLILGTRSVPSPLAAAWLLVLGVELSLNVDSVIAQLCLALALAAAVRAAPDRGTWSLGPLAALLLLPLAALLLTHAGLYAHDEWRHRQDPRAATLSPARPLLLSLRELMTADRNLTTVNPRLQLALNHEPYAPRATLAHAVLLTRASLVDGPQLQHSARALLNNLGATPLAALYAADLALRAGDAKLKDEALARAALVLDNPASDPTLRRALADRRDR